jgi:hypothetical protein
VVVRDQEGIDDRVEDVDLGPDVVDIRAPRGLDLTEDGEAVPVEERGRSRGRGWDPVICHPEIMSGIWPPDGMLATS